MYRIKVKSLKNQVFAKSTNIYIYTLLTNLGEINLCIAKSNIEKLNILNYINYPFYIILMKKVTSTISINDHFEISTDEHTLDMECDSSCCIQKSLYAK